MSWIKCTDVMPEVGVWVLITIDIPYNNLPPSVDNARWTTGGEWHTLNAPWSAEQVSHWTPQPAPAEGWLGNINAAAVHFRKYSKDLPCTDQQDAHT